MGFSRKLKRKNTIEARKKLMKEFKRTMRTFQKMVKCAICDRAPNENEKIDNWRINQESENIDLVCESCHMEQQLEERGVQE